MTAELAIKAIKNVCLNVKDTEEILLHSDLGVQYTSHVFEIYLKERGILHSFSRKEIPYDNVCIESFHSILKNEEVNQRIFLYFSINRIRASQNHRF